MLALHLRAVAHLQGLGHILAHARKLLFARAQPVESLTRFSLEQKVEVARAEVSIIEGFLQWRVEVVLFGNSDGKNRRTKDRRRDWRKDRRKTRRTEDRRKGNRGA
jgi:hypothetical protein